MPHSTTALTPRAKRVEKAARAKKLLSGKQPALGRDDSDDELGTEDHPWEWVYEKGQNADDEDEDMEESGDDNGPSRKRRRRNTSSTYKGKIIGARMGTFSCKVGDCVLVKAEGSNSAWVAMISDFTTSEEGDKCAKFLWFVNHEEIHNKKKKRTDFIPVSLLSPV